MSSSQVPLWVPLVVAMFGVVGVVLGQWISARREDRRWSREQEREDVRWRRERERDHDQRLFDGRAAGYAELIGAIESFDFVLYGAMRRRESGAELGEQESAELRDATTQARQALGAVTLHAPERIRDTIRESVIPRSRLAAALLDPADADGAREQWKSGQTAYRRMRAAMRRDLGLDAEDPPVPHPAEALADGPDSSPGARRPGRSPC